MTERGQARLPDLETADLVRCFHLLKAILGDGNVKSDQLEVRKVGLAPAQVTQQLLLNKSFQPIA